MEFFTYDQLKRAANILDNLGQVMFAAVVLSPIISSGVAKLFTPSSTFGILSTLTVWWFSLRLERSSS